MDTTRKKLALFYFTSTIHAVLQENFNKFVLFAVIANFVNLRRGVCPSVQAVFKNGATIHEQRWHLKLWIATPCIRKARNDGQKAFCSIITACLVILSLLQKGKKSIPLAVILSELCERKIQRNLRHALNLWILRYAQYDKK